MFIAAITVVIGSKNVKFPHSNKKVEYSEDCFLLWVKLLNITVSRYLVANNYFNNPENIVTPMRKFFHTKTLLLLSNKLMLKQIPKQFFFYFFFLIT